MKCIRTHHHFLENSIPSPSSSSSTSNNTTSASSASSSTSSVTSSGTGIQPLAIDPEEETSRWLKSVNINRLEELLKRNKQRIDWMDERGHTLLHLAILANRIEIVQLLISLGANVTLANRDGWSPLHIAAYSGNSDIINFLLQNKL